MALPDCLSQCCVMFSVHVGSLFQQIPDYIDMVVTCRPSQRKIVACMYISAATEQCLHDIQMTTGRRYA
jgi:hypothetical protein